MQTIAKRTTTKTIDMNAEEFYDKNYVIHINDFVKMPKTELYELMEAYHKAEVEGKSKNMYKTIWQTAVNLGFKFNETDAHEMTLEIKKQLLKQ